MPPLFSEPISFDLTPPENRSPTYAFARPSQWPLIAIASSRKLLRPANLPLTPLRHREQLADTNRRKCLVEISKRPVSYWQKQGTRAAKDSPRSLIFTTARS